MRSRFFLLLISVLASFFAIGCENESKHNLLDIYIAWNDVDVPIGERIQLEVRCYPDDASLGIPKVHPVWSSSDTTVAVVGANGLLTTVGYGRTVVRVQWGGFRAERIIRVNAEVKMDDSFLQSLLLKRFDADHNGRLEGIEIENVTGLDLSDLSTGSHAVSFRGLEVFTRLNALKISAVNIGSLDISSFAHLERLDISQSYTFTKLDVRNCRRLRWLDCHACPNLESLVIGSYSEYGPCKLETLDCSRCNISSLDLSRCTDLEYLEYLDNPLESVDTGNSPKLKVVNGITLTRPDETEIDSVAP